VAIGQDGADGRPPVVEARHASRSNLRTRDARYRAIADKVHAATGTRVEDVMIVLSENDAIDWSFGGGIAQTSGVFDTPVKAPPAATNI